MFFKSIRFKITILYMAILGITLSSFSLILYQNVKAGLYSNMDALLQSRAGGISQAINTYWETSTLETADPGIRAEALRKRRNTNFARIAQRWVREESRDPKLVDIIVQVFDTDGNIIAASKSAQDITEIPKKFISVLQGRSRFDTATTFVRPGTINLRIFTAPVFESEKVAYIVQVSSPLTSIQAALNNLKVTLFVLLPITVLATGIVGAFLAKVTLRPVDNMIRQIHQIRAENMNLKIEVPRTKDEIEELAKTFNGMLRRLERAFTSQKKLFEDLSHELKTPLTVLKGEFEVALKKARSPQEYEEALKSALEEVDNLTHLAENLLMLARFDTKETLPVIRKLDLKEVVAGVVNSVRSLSELKNIKMSFTYDSGALVEADEDQLRTLFHNIIDNAVKYTPEHGHIDVSVGKDKISARVRISDTGIGIAKEDLAHVFERFWRVDKSHATGGFGLGLSIAKSIAESHGGGITVESMPSRGATFTIRLPLTGQH